MRGALGPDPDPVITPSHFHCKYSTWEPGNVFQIHPSQMHFKLNLGICEHMFLNLYHLLCKDSGIRDGRVRWSDYGGEREVFSVFSFLFSGSVSEKVE